MSVNQVLLPDAIRSLIVAKQKDGFFGEISITLVRGEIQSVSVSARKKLEDLVADELIKGKHYIIKANRSSNRSGASVETSVGENVSSTEVLQDTSGEKEVE